MQMYLEVLWRKTVLHMVEDEWNKEMAIFFYYVDKNGRSVEGWKKRKIFEENNLPWEEQSFAEKQFSPKNTNEIEFKKTNKD